MLFRTLVLNSHWRPHEVVGWQEAVTRMFNGKVEVQASYDEVLAHIGTRHLQDMPGLRKALRALVGTNVESFDVKVPAVVVNLRKTPKSKSGVKFSRINVCTRDSFTCQYCAKRLPMSQLNYEHVVPRAQGGETEWQNIVMSCYPCNSKKDDKTPEQAGMRLLRQPVKPKELPMTGPYLDSSEVPEEWLPYLGEAATA